MTRTIVAMLALLLAPGALADAPEPPVQVGLELPLELVGACMEQVQGGQPNDAPTIAVEGPVGTSPCSTGIVPDCSFVYLTIYTDPYRVEPSLAAEQCANEWVFFIWELLIT